MQAPDARTRTAVRAGGVALVILAPLALAVAVGAGPAAAAKPPAATDHPLLDAHWNGVSDASAGVATAPCDYQEVDLPHSGVGWHFVLPGKPANMSSFSANFATAGTITVTTTESPAGVIVQSGKGAVVWTPTHDTLTAIAGWHDANGDHAGQGVNSAPNNHYLQLSHICGTGPTPTETESTSPTPSETESESPSESPSESESPEVVVSETSSAGTEVEGEKVTKTQGEQTALPATGTDLRWAFALALAMLALGAVLVVAPDRFASGIGYRRRH